MYKHSELTGKIIKCAQNVHSTLGFGFLEKVYHNALILEIKAVRAVSPAHEV